MKYSLFGAAALATQAVAQTVHVALRYNGDFSSPSSRGDYNNVPSRKPIEVIMADPDTLGLLVTCFDAMMKEPANSVRSYLQVAGQHGQPYVGWDGDSMKGGRAGYCVHGSAAFCDIHRPMLRCMELRLLQWAYFIARWYTETFEQQAIIYRACDDLGLPYYDWAYLTYVPSIFTARSITVRSPMNGQSITFQNNPFYSFTFPQSGEGASTYNQLASPNGGRLTTTFRDPDWINQILAYQPSLKQQVRQYLTTKNAPFNNMCTSNDRAWSGSGSSIPPLESMHNTVHSCIGGVMNSIDLSSYDPIFWLHHCNVDRLYALYQELNPSVKLSSGTVGMNSWGLSSGTPTRQNMQMYPYFANWQGTNVYTPAHVQWCEKLNYTYDCIKDNRDNWDSYISSRYGSSVQGRAHKHRKMRKMRAKRQATIAGANTDSATDGFAKLPENKDTDSAAASTDNGAANTTPPAKFDASALDLVDDPPTSVVAALDDVINDNGEFYQFQILSSIPKSCAKNGGSYHFFLTKQTDEDKKGGAATPQRPGWVGVHATTMYMADMPDSNGNGVISLNNALMQARAQPESHLDKFDLTSIKNFVAYNFDRIAIDSGAKTDITQDCLECKWEHKVVYFKDTAETADTQYKTPQTLLDLRDDAAVAAAVAAFIASASNVTDTAANATSTATAEAAAATTSVVTDLTKALTGDDTAKPATDSLTGSGDDGQKATTDSTVTGGQQGAGATTDKLTTGSDSTDTKSGNADTVDTAAGGLGKRNHFLW